MKNPTLKLAIERTLKKITKRERFDAVRSALRNFSRLENMELTDIKWPDLELAFKAMLDRGVGQSSLKHAKKALQRVFNGFNVVTPINIYKFKKLFSDARPPVKAAKEIPVGFQTIEAKHLNEFLSPMMSKYAELFARVGDEVQNIQPDTFKIFQPGDLTKGQITSMGSSLRKYLRGIGCAVRVRWSGPRKAFALIPEGLMLGKAKKAKGGK